MTATSLGVSGFSVSLVFCNNYGNAKTAQKIVDQLKTCKLGDLRESEFSSDHAGKIGYLAENGFINDQIVGSIESMIESWRALKNKEIMQLHSRNYEAKLQTISQIQALEAEWNKYRTDYIVPYLPSPLTAQ